MNLLKGGKFQEPREFRNKVSRLPANILNPGIIRSSDPRIGLRHIRVLVGQNIQKALDILSELGGGVISLEAGTHLPVSDLTVSSNVSIEGEGFGITKIDFGSTTSRLLFHGTARTIGGTLTLTEGSTAVVGVGTTFTNASAGDLIYYYDNNIAFYTEISSITDNTNVVLVDAWPMGTATGTSSFIIFDAIKNGGLSNLTIQNGANSTAGTGSLEVKNAVNFVCENVRVYGDSSGIGVVLDTIFDSEFRNCESSYNGNGSADDGFSIATTRRVSFFNCSAIGNAGKGFDIDYTLSGETVFVACISDGNTGDGYGVTGQATLIACRAAGNDGDGFDLSAADRTLIEGCFALDNASDGIELSATTDNVTISNCRIQNNDAYGINILSGATGNKIINPFFSGNSTGKILDAGTNTYYENKGMGTFTAANGANNNIDVGENLFITITGPSAAFNISGMLAGINGKKVVLYNSVAQDMTITNDATSTSANRILTLTGADVTLTGVSVATFIYNATDSRWILVGTQG